MTKELDALEVSKQLKDFVLEFVKNGLDRRFIHGSFEIIETALKDYENLKLKHKSMQDAVLDDFKKLKALEIIKEKQVNVDNFLRHIKKETDYKEYKRLCGLYKIMVFSDKDLTQEEYDLLKEVLL